MILLCFCYLCEEWSLATPNLARDSGKVSVFLIAVLFRLSVRYLCLSFHIRLRLHQSKVHLHWQALTQMWTFKQHCPVVLQSSLTATGIDMEVEVVTDYILSCKSMIIVNRGWGTLKRFSQWAFFWRGWGRILSKKVHWLVGVIFRRMQHLESYQIRRNTLPLHGQMKIKSPNTQQPLRCGKAFI